MGEVGFDPERLPRFADDVGASAPGLATLATEISGLREEARPLLDGTMPSEASPSRGDQPTDIGIELLDVKTEIKRRITKYERLERAQRMFPWLDPGDAFDLDLVDDGKVDEAADAVDHVLNGDHGMNGNRDDIEKLMEQLSGLNPEERDALVDRLTDEQLAELGDVVEDTDDSGWSPFDHNGLERWERLDFYGLFLSQVSPSRLQRLTTAWPEVNPGFASTDVALDGSNSQTGEEAAGINYGVPEGDVFELDADGNPVVDTSQMDQGRLADCWFIASVLAAQGADESFIPDHMQVNPNGTISVKLYDDGEPHWVTVTEELPLNDQGEPIGAESADGLLWGAYYEKAFALAYQDDQGGAPDGKEDDDRYDRAEEGTYGALEWDYTDAAAPYITGHDPDDIGHDFEEIQDRFSSGEPIIVSTPGSAPNPPDEWGNAYSTRHMYYVTAVTDDTITVSNPWGADYPEITMDRDEFDDYFSDAVAFNRE